MSCRHTRGNSWLLRNRNRLVNPIAAVGQVDVRALVGGVQLIAEGDRREARGARRGGDAREAIQVIVLFRGGHPRGPVLSVGNLAQQGRVGNIFHYSRPDRVTVMLSF